MEDGGRSGPSFISAFEPALWLTCSLSWISKWGRIAVSVQPRSTSRGTSGNRREGSPPTLTLLFQSIHPALSQRRHRRALTDLRNVFCQCGKRSDVEGSLGGRCESAVGCWRTPPQTVFSLISTRSIPS